MKQHPQMSTCEKEATIAAAVAKDELSDDLRLHIRSCAVCTEVVSTARYMQTFAQHLAQEPCPPAASMWWRLSLRTRRERALRAQVPLIWMARILYVSLALLAAFLIAMIPDASRPVYGIGFLALGAVALPVAITLWGWSRSKT
jgi:hypothetical protein